MQQEHSSKVIEASLKKASAALREAEIPHLLMGSLAGWAHGGPLTRKDLDFAIRHQDAERALEVLEEAGLRPEIPPEGWLYKAWDGDVLIDLIFYAKGLEITDEVIARGVEIDVQAMPIRVMALEDVFATKLLALDEHECSYGGLLELARALREKVDWDEVHRRTREWPFGRAFFVLLEGLGIIEESPVRVAEAGPAPPQSDVRVRAV